MNGKKELFQFDIVKVWNNQGYDVLTYGSSSKSLRNSNCNDGDVSHCDDKRQLETLFSWVMVLSQAYL